MKQNIHSFTLMFFLLFLIITNSQALARFLASEQGEGGPKLHEITTLGSLVEMEENDSLNELKGLEDCHNGDEECVKRRMVAEAHLDYIYTQHHKP
ncbi:hypothetical protein CsSME_00046641 [Camellia sinensis var. sinensis]|uniref:putative phytosulfokines 6 n=1 Tax=Camellia sinensis TaxID=4442 RepID=UPI001036D7E4|nr:putative phytosulfokines 6 [Camellia sinensis]